MSISDNQSELAEQQHPNYYDFSTHVENLPRINSLPNITGTIRQHYSDFEVTEQLSFEPCGQGEHLFLYIEKQSCNSQWVADELQKHFKLRSQDVGYAGKKDRYSISRQWFSLHLPGKENEITETQIHQLDNSAFSVLEAIRHNKKLRKGVIKHNHFKIKVKNISAEIDCSIIDKIKTHGFPNYFGYQRFGFNGNNLVSAEQIFHNKIRVRSRNKRGMYLSAARSYLFNLNLAERIKLANWLQVLKGDCLSLSGSQSYFVCEDISEDILKRFALGDLHISGWLAGLSQSEATGEALKIETKVFNQYADWIKGLSKEGLSSSRRAMRVIPTELSVSNVNDSELTITFCLPPGSFATSLLRELFIINDAAIANVTTVQDDNN
jgi:tRNA pseudouridine13 synthase